MNHLALALDDIQMLKGVNRTQLLQAIGQTSKKVHSKRQVLKKSPSDWKIQILNRRREVKSTDVRSGFLS